MDIFQTFVLVEGSSSL